MESFRTELGESQKHRNDLHRWKAIVVSTLAGTSLGFIGSSTIPNSELLLSIIPFVCAYIDLLYYHDGIVINIIGTFLRFRDDQVTDTVKIVKHYEQFTGYMRNIDFSEKFTSLPVKRSAYQLEKIATLWSSIVVSALVLAYPFSVVLYQKSCPSCSTTLPITSILSLSNIVIVTSGLTGIVLTVLIYARYQRIRAIVRDKGEKWLRPSAEKANATNPSSEEANTTNPSSEKANATNPSSLPQQAARSS